MISHPEKKYTQEEILREATLIPKQFVSRLQDALLVGAALRSPPVQNGAVASTSQRFAQLPDKEVAFQA